MKEPNEKVDWRTLSDEEWPDAIKAIYEILYIGHRRYVEKELQRIKTDAGTDRDLGLTK